MEIKFIGQGYNLKKNTSVAVELINALNSTEYHSFRSLVAFASFGGVSGLTPHVQKSKEHYKHYQVIVGIDNNGTSKEALEELLKWDIDTFVYHSRSPNIFHPKIYLFEGDKNYLAIIGSNNLTEMGLSKNIEGAVLIKYSAKEDDNNSIIKQIESYFENLFKRSDENLKKLSTQLILDLESMNILLPLEVKRNEIHDVKPNLKISEIPDKLINFFKSSKLQENPEGFKPKRKKTTKKRTDDKAIKTEKESNETDKNNVSDERDLTWSIKRTSEILIAEVGRGDRWKQVNFPKKMFQDFFGAEVGDNTYHIKIREVLEDGNLKEIENRQAVTVRSQNYRFEIGAAKGKYPTGKSRPIVVFIKISNDKFLYSLFMPEAKLYENLNTFLNDEYLGSQRNLKRIQRKAQTLKEECSDLPFWNIQLLADD